MKTLSKRSLRLAVVALWAGSVVPLPAATTIFDNSVYDLGVRFNIGTTEVGDEIILAGTERYLTEFSFEFWGANTASPGNLFFAGAVEAKVRFYENNGPPFNGTPFNGYATPNNMFFDSGWFSVGSPTARASLLFSAGTDFPSSGLFIPVSDMTWSVQFRNLGATDSVGVDLYSPPVVGWSYPDYWQNNGGWTLRTSLVPMDFAARMEAIVPEPSAITLWLLEGLGILTLARRLRRKGQGEIEA